MGSQRRAHRLARTAFALGLAAVGLLITATGLGGAVAVALIAVAALALAAVGGWWALTHHGIARAAGLVIAIGALVAMVVLYAGSTVRWLVVLGAAVVWCAALACARAALRADHAGHGTGSRATPPPRRPLLIMNPASGGGKVGRFDLVRRAEALGCRVVLLDVSQHQDVAAIARQALADGADLLGVAGGDGTQALVAGVAAAHGVPFLVISAGTRNHFALDLGLDREDPSRCLDALADGVELRVDLGEVAGRTFVNNASFGVYAEIVQRPEYRDAKAATTLAELPDLLTGYSGAKLTARVDGVVLPEPQALLVSSNPYDTGWYGSGRRPRLDTGELGVIGLTVRTAAQAADLALLGEQSRTLTAMTAQEVVVTADTETIGVGVDGEALTLAVPVRCRIVPGALRVRVPRERPGVAPARQRVDWRRLGALALGRSGSSGAA
ncbi:diacylglycerol kinase catalytic region [Catenulispora acidiphila DSM 44928]|uniref:Diacylglycerol kinase catalytic region n=1 Tax=Catenulispora acidiphila (strain DSM 44928 / JCM 14897 / NBRC 102108 / NRRL B-24433 / ID139908) TaxID=479433 RepID=C7PYE9_CATAD|nr:diacylglycerol kinase catalytic region [Catenulispora acidiphila DSM 44928]